MIRLRLCTIPCAAILLFSAAGVVDAQPTSKRAAASRLTGPAPRIDGRLDDAAWTAGAQAIEDFGQQRPIEDAEPSERTRVFVRYDAQAIYIGARMFRRDPTQILRSIARRDGQGSAEHLQVTFDTHRDLRTGYGFVITAAGARSDYHHARDEDHGARQYQFDPVWEARARVDSLGWTAEMRIPFSQMRFPSGDKQEWGFQLSRWMPDRNEHLQWVVMHAQETGYISRFGVLDGIAGIVAKRPVELMPYVSTDATRAALPDPANPFSDPAGVRLGADAKFGVGPNLTLDATINPDFGQVEADPAEVNLSAFETIVEERRPFFTEGSQLLRVEGPNYFYSRRIGAPPHLGASGDFVDMPRSSTILGAAKLSGRTANRLSVGALFAVTDEEQARAYNSGTGVTTRPLVEPRTVYGAVRLQQELGRQASTLGGMLTAVRRDLDADAAFAPVLTRDAVAGGLDWRIRWKEGKYAVTGWAGFSHVRGDSLAIARIQRSSAHYYQRPDAEHLEYDPSRTSLTGYTASIRADKDAGRRILWGAQVTTETKGYEVNDAGRVQSVDDVDYNADIQIRETVPGRYLRNWRLGFVTRGSYNYGGNRTNEEWNQNTSIGFLNFWSLNVNTRLDRATFDDVLTRGGPLMRTAASWGQEYRLNSPGGARTGWRGSVNWGLNAQGGWRANYSAGLTIRPGARWQLSLDPNYTVNTDSRQYVSTLTDANAVSTFGARYVFAYVDRVTTSVRGRLNYAFSPNLTLEGYAEPFAASGRYHALGELETAGSDRLRTFGTGGTTISRGNDGAWTIGAAGKTFTISNRDFNVLSLRSNVVLRWEWAAGSTLYAVWQQNRRAAELVDERARVGDLFNTAEAPGDNVFALKLSYWLPVGAGR